MSNELDFLRRRGKIKTEIAIIFNFYTQVYEKNMIHKTLSGDKFIFYSDNSYEIVGHVEYKEYNENLIPIFTLQSELAIGKPKNTNQSNDAFAAFQNLNQLELFYFPNDVFFSNATIHGKSNHLYYDIPKHLVYSKNNFEFFGNFGKVQGHDFKYQVDTEEFTTNEKVKGFYVPLP